MNNLDLSLIKELTKSFTEHLEIENNQRIILSGKFGTGKSTFVNNFFSDSGKYNAVYLFPVNYSVGSNEDIFKYIKYDILLELFSKKYPIEVIPKLDIWGKLASFFHKNSTTMAASYIAAIPGVGKEITLASSVLAAWNEIVIQLDSLKSSKDNLPPSDLEAFEKFTETIINKEGSLYEFGIETMLIRNMLEKKQKDDKKENVLIIDDLDRIDPEHIFRIFNVFGTHFNDQKNYVGNKFGFDKVVMICDIDNVRSFFHHKYGHEGDFSGYIDKFYSHNIFSYLDFEAINYFSRKLLSSINVIDQNERKTNTLFNDGFVFEIVRELIINRAVNLRNISKWHGKTYVFKKYSHVNDHHLNTEIYPIINKMDFLCEVIGHKVDLIGAIKKINTSKMLLDPKTMMDYALPLIEVFTYGNPPEHDIISFKLDGLTFVFNRGKEDGKASSLTYKGENILQVYEIDMGSFLKNCLIEYLIYLN
ncbi:MAG: P-loop NTPase fold protein [Candidatus Pedobacter colombiensis]|uniref:P-loop NTPase fold protein n=1 Tax=Candidatus Pedobacter colombiensis TaxID=3121371 RepID=A0AAJ5W6K2_9SPHI|nr:P-loop NTPase fold protein [Pedobacter sp.]WEK17924.1 MAG: P-loop NTPase fold protein [Pedobacter sp.]